MNKEQTTNQAQGYIDRVLLDMGIDLVLTVYLRSWLLQDPSLPTVPPVPHHLHGPPIYRLCGYETSLVRRNRERAPTPDASSPSVVLILAQGSENSVRNVRVDHQISSLFGR